VIFYVLHLEEPMKSPTSLTIKQQPIAALQLDPRNARMHTSRQIRQIAKSIEAFGFNVPVLVDHAGKVLAGHGRVLACQKLGWEHVPTIELAHLTPEQARAFAIADNRLTETSSWDDALLAESLRELAAVELNFDIEATGFTMGEIDLRIEESISSALPKSDPADQLPSIADGPPVSALGDVWQLGRHRLVCGNALDPEVYAALLDGKQAQMVFTDPPYNVPIHGHVSGKGAIQHREFAMGVGEMNAADFTAFLSNTFRLLAQNTDSGSIHFICMDWRHSHEMTVAGNGVYSELKNICVWVKDNGGMGSLYRSRHEFIFVFKSGTGSHRNNVQLGAYGRYRTNVWEYPGIHTMNRQSDEGNLLALHPTVKPVQMVADAMLDCSARGDIVLDPFLGSGTSVLAAERIGRSCYGMELDPRYVDVAIQRWQRHTGQEAVHVASGITFQARLAHKQDPTASPTTLESSHV
jgi:DNA modification methylase